MCEQCYPLQSETQQSAGFLEQLAEDMELMAAGQKHNVIDAFTASNRAPAFKRAASLLSSTPAAPAATPGDVRLCIKKALRDELMHPYAERGEMEAYRAIERAMNVVDKVFDAALNSWE